MLLTSRGLHDSNRRGWPTAWLVEIDWPDTPVRLWDGLGDLRYEGQTYRGVRNMGRITGVGGSKRIAVRQVVLELAGVSPHVEEFLTPVIRNRIAKAWLIGMDKDGRRVNGDGELVVEGRCDQREVFLDQQRRTGIRLTIAEPTYLVERAQNLRYTAEWIKSVHGDEITGLDHLSTIENERIPWTLT